MGSIFDFSFLTRSINQLAGQLSSLRQELEKLRREREDLACRAASKEDVISLLCQRIDLEAEKYPASLVRQLGAFLPSKGTRRLGEENFFVGNLLPHAVGAGNGMSASTLFGDLTFIFRAQIKEGITAAIKAAPWPEHSVSLAERNKRLAELDEQIGDLEAKEAALRDIAAKSGLSLQ